MVSYTFDLGGNPPTVFVFDLSQTCHISLPSISWIERQPSTSDRQYQCDRCRRSTWYYATATIDPSRPSQFVRSVLHSAATRGIIGQRCHQLIPYNMRWVWIMNGQENLLIDLVLLYWITISRTTSSISWTGVHTVPGRVSLWSAPHRIETHSWTGFNFEEPFLGNFESPVDIINMTAESMYSRSYTATPPTKIFTPSRGDFERSYNNQRRDSKARLRRERSSSTPYTTSPMSLPDACMNNSMPLFGSPITPLSLNSDPMMSSMSNASLFSTSDIPGHMNHDIFDTAFPLYGTEFAGTSFNVPYTSVSSTSTMPSYGPRSHSLPQATSPYFFPITPVNIPTPRTQSQQSHLTRQHSHPQSLRIHPQTRPKPQCWDHGCNGRHFSTFSNLLRHQREKSGGISKPTCPKCGAEFTRTTARNGHMAHEKCKARRGSWWEQDCLLTGNEMAFNFSIGWRSLMFLVGCSRPLSRGIYDTQACPCGRALQSQLTFPILIPSQVNYVILCIISEENTASTTSSNDNYPCEFCSDLRVSVTIHKIITYRAHWTYTIQSQSHIITVSHHEGVYSTHNFLFLFSKCYLSSWSGPAFTFHKADLRTIQATNQFVQRRIPVSHSHHRITSLRTYL